MEYLAFLYDCMGDAGQKDTSRHYILGLMTGCAMHFLFLSLWFLTLYSVAQTQLAPHLCMPGATPIKSGCENQWHVIFKSLFVDASIERRDCWKIQFCSVAVYSVSYFFNTKSVIFF